MINKSILEDFDIQSLIMDASEIAEKDSCPTRVFKAIPLDIYGLLQFVLRPSNRLEELLPAAPTEAEQIKWTGTAGAQLVDVASVYVKSMLSHVTSISGKRVEEITFLDHGCGWGRIPRFVSKFLSSEQIFGFDPLASSIAICGRDRVPGVFKLCEAYPESLPVNVSQRFDVINVFSVFTHLNEKYQFKLLETLREYVSSTGVLVATIRRESFWQSPRFEPSIQARMIKEHRAFGFAHMFSGNLGLHDAPAFFGETTTSIDYVRRYWRGWKLVATDITASQPTQIVLFLQPN